MALFNDLWKKQKIVFPLLLLFLRGTNLLFIQNIIITFKNKQNKKMYARDICCAWGRCYVYSRFIFADFGFPRLCWNKQCSCPAPKLIVQSFFVAPGKEKKKKKRVKQQLELIYCFFNPTAISGVRPGVRIACWQTAKRRLIT